jgi:LPS sulfotransferase NodH
MPKGYHDYFVVLAGMRTGSNLLEEQLAAMPGIQSYGELFNPHFFGKPKQSQQFDLSMETRDRDPVCAIDAMREQAVGLPGFRLFYDHDQRVIDHVLADPGCAKIVLTRRPVDSYVSLKIARQTGQWWLGDMQAARSAKVAFDAGEYAEFLNTLTAYQERIRHALQVTGQTAFQLDYSDLSDPQVIAGLGRYLGSGGVPDQTKVRAKVQNPKPVSERLTNAAAAEDALRQLALPDLGYIPSHEPERGPGLRLFHACRTVPLLYMPIRGAGPDPAPSWMQRLDPEGSVDRGMTQKEVRRWMRQHPGHRSFTILRHPLPRAYDAFCKFVLPSGIDGYGEIREALVSRYNVPLPVDGPGEDWTIDRQRDSFLAFLNFLGGNLGGQTSVRVDYSWASQLSFLEAISRFAVPDRVIRENTVSTELEQLAELVGCADASWPGGAFHLEAQLPLESIRTAEIDAACQAAYRRDYVFFGFEAWTPMTQAA